MWLMTHVHAFSDDALGDHDAVGLVEAIQSGLVTVPEVVEAAIGRIEKVNPELNGLAYAAFDRARVEARTPQGGYFCGVPTLVKDNCDAEGMPTQQAPTPTSPGPPARTATSRACSRPPA